MAKPQIIRESVKYDSVSFDKGHLQSFKKESDFLKEYRKADYAHIFPGENREAKLKEVYALVHKKKASEPEK